MQGPTAFEWWCNSSFEIWCLFCQNTQESLNYPAVHNPSNRLSCSGSQKVHVMQISCRMLCANFLVTSQHFCLLEQLHVKWPQQCSVQQVRAGSFLSAANSQTDAAPPSGRICIQIHWKCCLGYISVCFANKHARVCINRYVQTLSVFSADIFSMILFSLPFVPYQCLPVCRVRVQLLRCSVTQKNLSRAIACFSPQADNRFTLKLNSLVVSEWLLCVVLWLELFPPSFHRFQAQVEDFLRSAHSQTSTVPITAISRHRTSSCLYLESWPSLRVSRPSLQYKKQNSLCL